MEKSEQRVQNRKEECRADAQSPVREVVLRDGQALWAALGLIYKKRGLWGRSLKDPQFHCFMSL